nr:biotin--[acetyl-CoA-carboxylase] ligase [Thiohalospira halophila]
MVERSRHGYRIPPSTRPPRADLVAGSLPPGARQQLASLQSLYRTDSTNSWLLRHPHARQAGGAHICIAASQTAGRGRLGRVWDSPAGAGLYLSVSLVRSGLPAPATPLAIATLVGEAIEAVVPGARVALKWPNDLLLQGGKLGGILMESRGEYGGQWQLVVGIGLNLEQPAFGGRTSLRAAGLPVPRAEDLAVGLLSRILPTLPLVTADPGPWLDGWRQRDYYRGREVRVQGPEQIWEGRAAGIEADGALCLETAAGLERINGGDVSLREAQWTG